MNLPGFLVTASLFYMFRHLSSGLLTGVTHVQRTGEKKIALCHHTAVHVSVIPQRGAERKISWHSKMHHFWLIEPHRWIIRHLLYLSSWFFEMKPSRASAQDSRSHAGILRRKWQTGSGGHARPNVGEQLPIISYCWEGGRSRQCPSDGPGQCRCPLGRSADLADPDLHEDVR